MSDFQIETRRRSRSKTPFLRSSCDHESCEHAGEDGHAHHKKKAAAPNVQTIIEEAVEVTSSSSSAPASKLTQAKSQQKTKTSDYSSEDASPETKTINKKSTTEQKQSSSFASTTQTQSTTSSTTIITKSKKVGGSGGYSLGSTAATSTPKGSYLLNSFLSQYSNAGTEGARYGGRRHKEVAQNEINSEFERSQKEEANKSKSSRSFSRIFGSTFGNAAANEQSFTGDSSDHLAYMEYKRAGEYWKKTPKTDYTYSELSPHRRVLAPGIIAMPNMSRRSLENHHERIDYMISRDPAQEEFIRRRYETSKYAQNRRDTAKLTYDSGDEVDDSQFEDYRKKQQLYYNNGAKYQQQSEESWFMRIITTIVTSVTSVWSSATGGGAAIDESAMYRTKYAQQERGFFGSIAHGVSSVFAGLFRYIYLFISSVLCLDTWLLQSSNAENKSKKRFLLFLLMLLPLLLLAAWSLLTENERLYYLQRTQALLPLSLLASVKSTLHSGGTTLQGLFQLPAAAFNKNIHFTNYEKDQEAAAAKIHLAHIAADMQKALTADEYENILKHVNSYVQQLVELKMQNAVEEQRVAAQLAAQNHQQQSAQITPQQTQLIVQIMRENLERLVERQKSDSKDAKLAAFSEADVQRLAQLVQLQLEASGWMRSAPVQLSSENFAQMRQLVQERIELNNHAHYTLLVEQIDLEALMARILLAPQLRDYVDARLNVALDGRLLNLAPEGSGASATAALEQQQQSAAALINELSSEIAFIKLALSDKLSENEDLQQSISKLRLSQDDLLKRMQQHELATDVRFSGLLAEIEAKLLALKDDQFALLNKQIKLSLVEILGFKQAAGAGAEVKLEDVDLQNWVRSIFVAKEYLEERLLALNNRTNDKIREEIDRSGVLLMRDISERLKREILLTVESKQNASTAVLTGQIRAALSEEEVRKLVKSVLAIYDADKTGLVDFALESAGGQILSTRCTESYQTKTAQLSVFGIPLWYPTNTPRVAISPNVQPGECWAFQGFPGFLVLKLNSMVYVTGFTLEHIPKSLAPNGRIDSAPRNFTVWGLEHEKDQEPILFGSYEYVDNDASLQYFPLQNKDIQRPYEIVELRMESNHGHPQYTCLYRFRVHGKPPAA